MIAKPGSLFSRRKGTILIVLGMFLGFVAVYAAHFGIQYSGTNTFCDQACHVHPEATQTWIKSTHYSNKSGVVTRCIECHLPAEGIEYYTEKARLGAQDVYGKLFKDPKKINWEAKRTLEHAVGFTYDDACVRCHQNLFSQGLSKKGNDAHLYYNRMKAKVRCINCHITSGHYRGKKSEQILDAAEVITPEDPKAFPTDPTGLQNYTEVIPGTEVKFEMVAIPGGAFQMGSPDSESYRRPDEGPMHPVKLNPFWMGRTEVKWREFEAYYAQKGVSSRSSGYGEPDAMTGPTPPYGSPDQGWGKGSRPIITLTHFHAMKYCEWLSSVTGKKFRLPTEAEWEYAARGGAATPYPFPGNPGDYTQKSWKNKIFGAKTDPIAKYIWYEANSAAKSHPAESEKPNPWGLLNMLGNIREYCLDYYDAQTYSRDAKSEAVENPRGPEEGKEHVIRGGSYKSDAADVRAAARDHTRHDAWMVTDPQDPKSVWWYSDCVDIGFRVVREINGSKETTEPRK